MSTIFLRAFVLYIIMLVTLRGMGKHQLGQYQPYEFAMALLIADLISTPMSNVSTPLLHGVLPVGALFITHGIITLLCMRSDRFREIVSGKPRIIIQDGIIDRKTLNRLCLTLSDVLEGLRTAGIMDPDDLGSAMIEANGAISAFPSSSRRPPTAQEMQINTPPEKIPLTLIMDGRLQSGSLKNCGQNTEWLENILSGYGMTAKNVLLATLNAQGKLRVQTRDDTILYIQALKPQNNGDSYSASGKGGRP